MATLKELRHDYPDVEWKRVTKVSTTTYVGRMGNFTFAFPAQGKLEGTLRQAVDQQVQFLKDSNENLPKN